mmetsp:Transcript_26452/g.78254  ORF Transcript_26452/g.78254 Transcript_26452/m.78254 type:complete len:349 (+) Transcript_26452:1361-2407(+)
MKHPRQLIPIMLLLFFASIQSISLINWLIPLCRHLLPLTPHSTRIFCLPYEGRQMINVLVRLLPIIIPQSGVHKVPLTGLLQFPLPHLLRAGPDVIGAHSQLLLRLVEPLPCVLVIPAGLGHFGDRVLLVVDGFVQFLVQFGEGVGRIEEESRGIRLRLDREGRLLLVLLLRRLVVLRAFDFDFALALVSSFAAFGCGPTSFASRPVCVRPLGASIVASALCRRSCSRRLGGVSTLFLSLPVTLAGEPIALAPMREPLLRRQCCEPFLLLLWRHFILFHFHGCSISSFTDDSVLCSERRCVAACDVYLIEVLQASSREAVKSQLTDLPQFLGRSQDLRGEGAAKEESM